MVASQRRACGQEERQGTAERDEHHPPRDHVRPTRRRSSVQIPRGAQLGTCPRGKLPLRVVLGVNLTYKSPRSRSRSQEAKAMGLMTEQVHLFTARRTYIYLAWGRFDTKIAIPASRSVASRPLNPDRPGPDVQFVFTYATRGA